MSDEQIIDFRYFRCTFRHVPSRTERHVTIAVPVYSLQDALSSDEGYAWRGAERAIDAEQGAKGQWLHDMFRLWIKRIDKESME